MDTQKKRCCNYCCFFNEDPIVSDIQVTGELASVLPVTKEELDFEDPFLFCP